MYRSALGDFESRKAEQFYVNVLLDYMLIWAARLSVADLLSKVTSS
jgi:hypothetical protein